MYMIRIEETEHGRRERHREESRCWREYLTRAKLAQDKLDINRSKSMGLRPKKGRRVF